MELQSSTRISKSVDAMWELLSDPARLAPFLPGATLTSVDGDVCHGEVRVKIGPISAAYEGVLTFVERDEEHHRVKLQGEGRDRSLGAVRAIIDVSVAPDPFGCVLTVSTDLGIAGKVAQFGRSTLGEVAASVLAEFASRLENAELPQTGDEENVLDLGGHLKLGPLHYAAAAVAAVATVGVAVFVVRRLRSRQRDRLI